MHLNVRPYNNHQPLLLPPAVQDYLPEDHPSRRLDEVVEHLDLSDLYRKIPEVGNPSYHPAMLVKILFYGYMAGTRSSRKIQRKLVADLPFIFLSGMQTPDFRTISDFRKNNCRELAGIFAQIVQVCHHLGMTDLGVIALDSKVFKANASTARSLTDEQLLKEQQAIERQIAGHLAQAINIDEEEDRKYGHDKRGDEIPEEISTREKRLAKLNAVAADLKEARRRLKEQGTKKINLTDRDARIQKDKERLYPGYRGQIAVDAKEQVIIAQDVTVEQNDTHQLVPMVDKISGAVSDLQGDVVAQATKLLADSSYSSLPNAAFLQKRPEIDPYIPDQEHQAHQRRSSSPEKTPFLKERFVFKSKTNSYLCPAGKELTLVGRITSTSGAPGAIYRCRECVACSHWGVCTTSKHGRIIKVNDHDRLVAEMRKKLTSEPGRKIYSRRKCTVEPVCGNLAHNLGFREFLLRGIIKVRGEFSLMCIAHNLVKITGYARRSGLLLAEALSRWKAIPVPVR